MNLYRVLFITDKGRTYLERYILACDKQTAIAKYIKITPFRGDYVQIQAFFICKRDEIIPTIEPIQEFL